jgi:hypothetical protein
MTTASSRFPLHKTRLSDFVAAWRRPSLFRRAPLANILTTLEPFMEKDIYGSADKFTIDRRHLASLH